MANYPKCPKCGATGPVGSDNPQCACVITPDRPGDWMQTASGGRFWPIDPQPHEIDINDIAHALSNLCRFGGHCQRFYSVAEHSVYVSMHVPREHALQALLHDASEAYCVDIPRPLKRFIPGYVEIEERIWSVIAQRFGVPVTMHPEVKAADMALCVTEARQIMPTSVEDWTVGHDGVERSIHCLPPATARRWFLSRFDALKYGGS